MVDLLIAEVHGFHQATAAVNREVASVVTEGFTIFPSAADIVVPAR